MPAVNPTVVCPVFFRPTVTRASRSAEDGPSGGVVSRIALVTAPPLPVSGVPSGVGGMTFRFPRGIRKM